VRPLTEQFKIEFPQFLEKFGIDRSVNSELAGTRYSGRGFRIVIPKARSSGFDISFDVYDDGVYPAVDGMYLYPLDVMANYELTWSKRFALSALSKEAQLTVFSFKEKPYRRSLKYFDPWSREIEIYSSPKWLFPFWKKGSKGTFQNQDIDLTDEHLAPLVREVNAMMERGQVL
jgi:hypothetical protein